MPATPTYSVFEDTRQAFCTTTSTDDGINERKLARTFNVLVTSSDYGLSPLQVEADTIALGEIPAMRSSHPQSPYLFVDSITTAPPAGNVTYYEVSVNYSSSGFEDGGGSPLDKPAETSFFTITSNEPIDADYNGQELKWAGTDEPITGLSIPLSDLALRAQKYIMGFNPVAFYNYINTVNSDAFLGFQPGTARIHDISASRAKLQGFDVWDMSIEIQFRKPYRGVTNEQAWYKRIKAEGFMVQGLERGTERVRTWRALSDPDDAESPLSPVPVLLDMEGTPPARRLLPGQPAQWALIQVFGTSSFSSLELGL